MTLAEATQKIAHKKSFCKLYGLPCPVPELLPHYVEALVQSTEYSWLPDVIEQYSEWSQSLGGETKDPIDGLRQRLISRLSISTAVKRLREAYPGAVRSVGVDQIHLHPGEHLIELDQRSANYNALRDFDVDDELPDWEVLIKQQGGPSFLARAKPFRQSVIGNVEVKRLQAIEVERTEKMAAEVARAYPGLRVVRMMPDELVFMSIDGVETAREIYGMVDRQRWRVQLWWLEKLDYVPGFLKRVIEMERPAAHRELYAVPACHYYHAFRRSVLGQVERIRDLYFTHEDRLARWAGVLEAPDLGIPEG